MIVRMVLIAALALPLAGCFEATRGSITGGECKVFDPPPFAVRGLRQYDQDWIDGNIEAGVGGCGWERPQVRPASMDASPAQKAKATPKPAKKRGIIKRIRDRIVHPLTVPVAPIVESPLTPVIVVPAPPPLLDPVDELLQPSSIRKVH